MTWWGREGRHIFCCGCDPRSVSVLKVQNPFMAIYTQSAMHTNAHTHTLSHTLKHTIIITPLQLHISAVERTPSTRLCDIIMHISAYTFLAHIRVLSGGIQLAMRPKAVYHAYTIHKSIHSHSHTQSHTSTQKMTIVARPITSPKNMQKCSSMCNGTLWVIRLNTL